MSPRLVVSNAFSLSMLPEIRRRGEFGETGLTVTTVSDPAELLQKFEAAGSMIMSAVGHADTAALFSRILRREIAPNRSSITLSDRDYLLVGQYVGPRLPEGCTVLPEGARIDWLRIWISF